MATKYEMQVDGTAKAPLFRKYDGQINPQRAYIYWTPGETVLYADYDGNVGGNTCPADVFHNRRLRFRVPATVYGQWLESLPQNAELSAMLDTVTAGHSVEWDGSNYVGKLTHEAENAYDAIVQFFERESVTCEVMSAREYVANSDDVFYQLIITRSVSALAQAYIDDIPDDYYVYGSMSEAICETIARQIDDENYLLSWRKKAAAILALYSDHFLRYIDLG